MSAQRSGLSKEEFKCVESRCLLLRVPIKRGSLGGGWLAPMLGMLYVSRISSRFPAPRDARMRFRIHRIFSFSKRRNDSL